jgi:hypothetical protein
MGFALVPPAHGCRIGSEGIGAVAVGVISPWLELGLKHRLALRKARSDFDSFAIRDAERDFSVNGISSPG